MNLELFINSKTGTSYIDVSNIETNGNGQKLSVISLFSGAGGLDIGLEGSGFTTAVCIEYDPDCRETLRYNRPDWKLFEDGVKIENGGMFVRTPGDIRDIGVEEILEFAQLKRGEAALVVGGAPCQPFSNIGKKLGKEDEKNGDLFQEFVRVVKGVEPRGFIFENVVGITQQKHADVIEYMVGQFRGLGYGISHAILNSANYGVPQRRERFFLVGIKGIEQPAFPAPTHFRDQSHFNAFTKDLDKIPQITYRKWKTVRDAFRILPKRMEDRTDYAVMNISSVVKQRMTMIRQGENFKVLPMEMRPDCWKSGRHQGNDTFGRMSEDLPSCTIRTAAYNPAKGQYIHPYEDRGLSTVEMAVLQSFPMEWRFRCKGSNRVTLVSAGRQIGNAVPPPLAKALGDAVKLQLLSSHSKSERTHFRLVEAS